MARFRSTVERARAQQRTNPSMSPEAMANTLVNRMNPVSWTPPRGHAPQQVSIGGSPGADRYATNGEAFTIADVMRQRLKQD